MHCIFQNFLRGRNPQTPILERSSTVKKKHYFRTPYACVYMHLIFFYEKLGYDVCIKIYEKSVWIFKKFSGEELTYYAHFFKARGPQLLLALLLTQIKQKNLSKNKSGNER